MQAEACVVWAQTNNQLEAALQELGVTRSKQDSCLYFIIEGGRMTFVTVYVDDFLIFTNDAEMKLKSFLNHRLKIKDIGEAKFSLGMKITRAREKGQISVNLQNYIEDILKRFNMVNWK